MLVTYYILTVQETKIHMTRFTRFSLISLLMILMSAFALAQCNDVNDNAGILGSKFQSVQTSVANLSLAGADAHVVTYSSLNGLGTLDAQVAANVKSCPSWQSPNHGTKSNLVVLAVSLSPRKIGIFAAPGYESAFDASRMTKWKQDYMAPAFHGGDYAAGFAATADQMAARLKAFKSESSTPVTNTTVNEASAPTNLTGLWIFLGLLGLGGIGFVIYLVFAARKRSKDELEGAQAEAISQRNLAAELVAAVEAALKGADLTKPGLKAANDLFTTASDAYTRLAAGFSGDPTSPDLGLGTYQSLQTQYQRIVGYLQRAQGYIAYPEVDPTVQRETSYQRESSYRSSSSSTRRSHRHSHVDSDEPVVRRPQPSTVIVNNNSDNSGAFVEGALLGSVLSDREDRESRYERSEPTRESEPEREEPAFTSSSASESYSEPERESPSFSDSSASESFSMPDSTPDFSSSSGSSDF